jgi:hypothetical protein
MSDVIAAKVWKPDGSTLILLDGKFPDTEGGSVRVYGHVHFGPFPKIGDEALFEGKSGGEHHFRFTAVEPCNDPREMYFGTIKRYRVTHQGEVLWEEPPPKAQGLVRRFVRALTSGASS